LFVYACICNVFEDQIIRPDGSCDPMNQLNPNQEPGFAKPYAVVFLVFNALRWGGCSFCSYWWNCWSSLFKRSFHNYE